MINSPFDNQVSVTQKLARLRPLTETVAYSRVITSSKSI